MGLILLSSALRLEAYSPPETPPLPILQSGIGVARLDALRVPVDFSVTPAGLLVSLQPLLRPLGGEIEIGPMGESHKLSLNQAVFAFGPGSDVVTLDDQLLDLSQPPILGPGGLQVPLDLLSETYGKQMGYEFSWNREEMTLEIQRLPFRELPVSFDLVHLQGVSTLVFQFPTQPRYRISESANRVDIEMVGDEIRVDRPRKFPRDPLIRDVTLNSHRIRIDLAPDADAQSYVLTKPYRLVFDVFRAPAAADQPEPPARPRRATRSVGIRTIVLDPGHGGADTGAIGRNGSAEKDLTLLLSRSLKRALQSRLGVKVVLTRADDSDLHLDSRTSIANQYKADLFISIHLNSSPGSSAQGAETYFSSPEPTDEQAALADQSRNRVDPLYDLQLILWDLAQSHHLAESQRLARIVQEELNLALELANRGVKQAPFRILMGAAMPAVLIELGFLSNPSEEAKLNEPVYRARLVDTLVRAIGRYRALVQGAPRESDEAMR